MKKFYDCGIDLGTTNSCISVPNNDNTCTLIDNITDRMQVTPSVVWIKGRRIVIGQRAYTCTNVKEVRKEFKRDMGTETVYEFAGSDKKLTPVDLSSEILKSLRRDAEQRTGTEMRDAVVTVPAAFNMVQCEATKKAAEKAGFRNIVLLQEPIAASIAYGAQPNAKDQYWLVFDYGGGTLDVSIISTNDDRLDNITSKGNNHMGGKDLDRILFEKVIYPKLKADFDLKNGLDTENLAKLMIDVERCKIELSNQNTAFFETFTAEDNSGDKIDIEYEIRREEFEEAISDEIHAAVQIARDALNDSGLEERQITKIILVGGTTFVPLVRRALKEEFSIALDSSLNPMTVVSKGAALFAASVVADEKDWDAFEMDSVDYHLDLEYEPMTSENRVNVIGRIPNSDGKVTNVKIDCISSADSESALWTSGWCDMMSVSQGLFDVDVQICNFGKNNIYRVSAQSSDGTNCPLTGYIFEIIHRETALKLSQPPLTHNIGIMVTDGIDNYVDWVFLKDTKLPVKSKPLSYVLNKTLRPEDDNEFTILVYEGDDKYNPAANDLIRRVHIRSRELTRTLQMGTPVEITIEINENREGTITGYVPLYDYELVADSLGTSEENYKNYELEMDQVERKLSETKRTIDILRNKGINVRDLEEEYLNLRNDFDKYFKLIGTANDEVHQYIQSFYRMQTKVILKERETREDVQKHSDMNSLNRMNNNIHRYGSDVQKAELERLKGQLNTAKNKDDRQFIMSKIDQLESDVVYESFEWLKMVFSIYFSASDYTDQQKASYWKYEGQQAVENHDTKKILQAINKLVGLQIKSASESVSMTLADLKKF